MKKRLKLTKKDFADKESHYVLEEPQGCEDAQCLETDEIKRVSKKEADKKLLLTRE